MPDILSAIHNGRGAVAMQINQPKDALDHYKKFKELQEKFHTQSGKFTTKFAASYSELGMAYLMNEVFTEETLELFDKSAAIRKKVTDYNKMDLYNTLRGKGLFYWHSGKYEEALECLLEALHDRENFFGSDDHNGPR
jgi:tetratricopeptide (TPR) repeat protein